MTGRTFRYDSSGYLFPPAAVAILRQVNAKRATIAEAMPEPMLPMMPPTFAASVPAYISYLHSLALPRNNRLLCCPSWRRCTRIRANGRATRREM